MESTTLTSRSGTLISQAAMTMPIAAARPLK